VEMATNGAGLTAHRIAIEEKVFPLDEILHNKTAMSLLCKVVTLC